MRVSFENKITFEFIQGDAFVVPLKNLLTCIMVEDVDNRQYRMQAYYINSI